MKLMRIVFIVVAGLFFYTILLAGVYRNIYLSPDGGKGRLGILVGPLQFMANTPSMIMSLLVEDNFYTKNNESEDGITFFKKNGIGSYPQLLVSFKTDKFVQKMQLLDLSTKKLIKEWAPDTKELYELAYNEANPRKPYKGSDLYLMHPLMTHDSSLIFTSQLTSLIAKVDSESNLLWIKNDKTYHHTVELDSSGRIVSCTRPFISGKYDFLPGEYESYKDKYFDDFISILDPDTGNTIFEKSVTEILVENGYKDLILYKGQVISDPIHLNDVQPAINNTDYWQTDDLLISCRNISAVFLYRPSTNKILWLKHGPWLNQHDADFYEKDKIVVFGNDVIRDESRIDAPLIPKTLHFSQERAHNEIYIYDLSSDSTYTPYTSMMSHERIRTITSGRCDILANGDVFVEETNNGRIIIGDSINKKMEFVKRLDNEYVSKLFWSRIID